MFLQHFCVLRELDPIVSVRMLIEIMQPVDNVRILHPNCSEALRPVPFFSHPYCLKAARSSSSGGSVAFVNKRLIDDAGRTAYKTSLHTGHFQHGLACTAREHNVKHDVAGISHCETNVANFNISNSSRPTLISIRGQSA